MWHSALAMHTSIAIQLFGESGELGALLITMTWRDGYSYPPCYCDMAKVGRPEVG